MVRRSRAILAWIVVLLGGGLTFLGWTDSLMAQGSDERLNEYRLTTVTSMPLSEKYILFSYLGYVVSPSSRVKSLYFSPPGLIIRPKPWIELWGAVFGIYNENEEVYDTLEVRPLVGVKLYVPNTLKMNMFSWTRFEYRRFSTNGSRSNNSVPRLRNRLGIEFPMRQATAWNPGTLYGLADVEPVYRYDEARLDYTRLRGGIGYVLNKTWRAEFIYHAQYQGPDGSKKDFGQNIWRLNIKLNLPPRGGHVDGAQNVPDIDD